MKTKCDRCGYDFTSWIKDDIMKSYRDRGVCAKCSIETTHIDLNESKRSEGLVVYTDFPVKNERHELFRDKNPNGKNIFNHER